MEKTPGIIRLEKLLEKQNEGWCANIVSSESDQIGALFLILCTPQKRKLVLSLLPQDKKLSLAKSLHTLRQPPEFVLEAVYENLRNKAYI